MKALLDYCKDYLGNLLLQQKPSEQVLFANYLDPSSAHPR